MTSGVQSEQYTDEEKGELLTKYSETEDMLNKRLQELEEAQKTIDELRGRIREYQVGFNPSLLLHKVIIL